MSWGKLFLLLLGPAFLLGGCARPSLQPATFLTHGLRPGETVAVTKIYDAQSGDVTGLSDYLCNRLESQFRRRGIPVKARQDLGRLVDEHEVFGSDTDSYSILRRAEADVVVTGAYSVIPAASGAPPIARLTLKALRADDSSVISSSIQEIRLPPDWARLAGVVKGNIYYEVTENIAEPAAGPRLDAHFDRQPACFLPGRPVRIVVNTEPGVHLYLLDFAADNTVTLLYPDALLPDQPLSSANFTFPPDALKDRLQLVFCPLHEGQTSEESIKVVASTAPIDFSWLPVPEGQIYAGARGGNLKRVAQVLHRAKGWSQKVLTYLVGEECR